MNHSKVDAFSMSMFIIFVVIAVMIGWTLATALTTDLVWYTVGIVLGAIIRDYWVDFRRRLRSEGS